MNVTRRRMASWLVFIFMAQILMGCASISTTSIEQSPTPGRGAFAPVLIESPNPASVLAQATIDSGQSQLLELSRKSTELSHNMAQGENSSALATQAYNKRQKLDLDNQATSISLAITQAAVTQESLAQQTKINLDYQATKVNLAMDQAASTQAFLAQQTKLAGDADAAAQSDAAAATQLAYQVAVTQTAQAQGMLDDHARQTAQAAAALTAYPMTATPLAAIKAALLMQEYDREQQSFVDRVVVPLVPFLAILDLLLFTALIIVGYRRFMSMPLPNRLRAALGNVNPRPINVIDVMGADPDLRRPLLVPSVQTPANPPRQPGEAVGHVEIVDATEPPVAHWIAEVEQQLAPEGDDGSER